MEIAVDGRRRWLRRNLERRARGNIMRPVGILAVGRMYGLRRRVGWRLGNLGAEDISHESS